MEPITVTFLNGLSGERLGAGTFESWMPSLELVRQASEFCRGAKVRLLHGTTGPIRERESITMAQRNLKRVQRWSAESRFAEHQHL